MTAAIKSDHIAEELQRSLQEICPMCGYSMIGNTSGTCPECGYSLPPNLLALPARNPVSISLAHIVALPIAFAAWLMFAQVIFVFLVPNTISASVLIPIAIVYIVSLVPLFFIVTRLVYRLTPIKLRFPYVFVTNAYGYGLCSRNGIGPDVMTPWSRNLQLRCKTREYEAVLIELGTPLWLDIAFRTEVCLSRDRADDLAMQIRRWIEYAAIEVSESEIVDGED